MSRTEAALQALVAAIAAKAAEVDPAIPAPLRNTDLVARLQEQNDGVHALLNVWDGEGAPTDETLGADIGGVIDDNEPGGYEIEHRAIIEYVVADGEDIDREAAFDAGMIAIHDVIRPEINGDIPAYLGGAVDYCVIERVTRSGLVTDGLPAVKAAEITVLLSFTSQRPF